MDLKKINEFTWQIEKQGNMKVPAIIYSSDKLIENVKKDKTIEQIKNVACLPGIQKAAYAMPDAHQGYGFPIGGVAAFDVDEGIISPGGVGYDINCGVRLLRTDLDEKTFFEKREEIVDELFKKIPTGVGKKSELRFTQETFKEILEKGAEWAVKHGHGTEDDLVKTEEKGCMKGADASKVSDRAIKRGMPQLGTLGSGNHFLEIQKVDKIYDKKIAEKFGIDKEGQILVMIHCGSRGLGHQVASDYIKKMEETYGIKNLPDRELINAPINSELGQDYFKAMCCAINFAFANRQIIQEGVRKAFKKVFGTDKGMQQIYDVCHNLAKFEEHEIDGVKKKLCVHRKGATRSFGPENKDVNSVYRDFGQPVILPGSMGTASYVLVGTKKAEEISFGSTAHGAGRVGSRSEALRTLRGENIVKDLRDKGIYVKGSSMKGIAEEAPQMYKDIDEVVKVSDSLEIGKLVARVVPLGVIKG